MPPPPLAKLVKTLIRVNPPDFSLCGAYGSSTWRRAWTNLQTKLHILRAGTFKESMGARHWGGIGFSYQPARLHRLTEFIPWNRFLGSINVQKYGLRTRNFRPTLSSATVPLRGGSENAQKREAQKEEERGRKRGGGRMRVEKMISRYFWHCDGLRLRQIMLKYLMVLPKILIHYSPLIVWQAHLDFYVQYNSTHLLWKIEI